jgi:hypothetical protein
MIKTLWMLGVLLSMLSSTAAQAQSVTVDASLYSSLREAVDAAGSGGTVYGPPGYKTTLTKQLVISQPVTFNFSDGATITSRVNNVAISVTSSGVSFTGHGMLTSNKSTYPGASAISSSGNHLEVGGWTFTGFNTYDLYPTGDSISIHDNYFMDSGYIAIFAKGNFTNSSIARNHIVCTGNSGSFSNSAIAIFSFGGDAHSVTIESNEIEGSCAGAGIVVGNFSASTLGAVPYDFHVLNNKATFTAIPGTIGYSFSAVAHSVIRGNTCTITDSSTAYACLESVSQFNNRADDNTFVNNVSTGAFQFCQTLDHGTSHTIVTGMHCTGFTQQGILLYTGGDRSYSVSNNNDSDSITGNTFIASAIKGAYLNGVLAFANSPTTSITNAYIGGNTFDMGQSSAAQNRGIYVNGTAGGLVNRVTLGPNLIRNSAEGVNQGANTILSGSAPTCESTVATCFGGTAITSLTDQAQVALSGAKASTSIAIGSQPAITGCGGVSGEVSGTLGGWFVAAAASCEATLSLGITADHGFACIANNQTAPIAAVEQIASTKTTATLNGKLDLGDLISFTCTAY